MVRGILRYREPRGAIGIIPCLRGFAAALLLCLVVLWPGLQDAAAQDGFRPGPPAAPAGTDTVFAREGTAPSRVRIRSFRGRDVRIIRRAPQPTAPGEAARGVAAGVSKKDLDALEARLLRAIEKRGADKTAVVVPERNPVQTLRPAVTRVETVYVQRPAPDAHAAAPPVAAVDTGAVVPSTRETKPAAAPVTLVKEVERSILEKGLFTALDVIFEFNKSRLMERSHVILNAIGQVLADHPGIDILIEGHTDSIGSAAYNLKLSEERAAATRQYLLDNFPAIAAERISVAGLGLTRPVADNSNETGRALNRRVEFRVTEHRGR